MYVLLNADGYLHVLLFQEIQIGPDHQAEVPEMMGPNYQDGESGQFLNLIKNSILIPGMLIHHY